MPTVAANGVTLRYVREGSGDPVVLLHGYLFGADWWRPQIDALKPHFEVVAVDLRGQMQSETTDDPAGYDLWNQAEDVLRLMEMLGIRSAHVVGLSMGGMIGLRLALRHPGAVRSLVLLDTSAGPEAPEAAERYAAMRQVVAAGQLEAVLPALPPVFFTDRYVSEQPAAVDDWLRKLRESNHSGLIHAGEAIDGRDDVTSRLRQIRVPTLVIHGSDDVAIPRERAEELAAGIGGARLVMVDAGHQSNVDAPEETSRLILEFLTGLSSIPASDG